MAEKSMFFDSIDGDREYPARDFAKYFSTLVTTGVFADQLDSLEVNGHGMELKSVIKPGRAFINGYFYENDDILELQHDTAHPTLDRIDRVVLRLDLSLEKREIRAVIIKGEPSEKPTPPPLIREGDIYDLPLAQQVIKAGLSYIPSDGSQTIDEREYVKYQAKPAWYPRGQVPMDAWMYACFPEELTQQEKEDIENNPSLMSIINKSSITEHGIKLKTIDYDIYTLTTKLYYNGALGYVDVEGLSGFTVAVFKDSQFIDTDASTAYIDTTNKLLQAKLTRAADTYNQYSYDSGNGNMYIDPRIDFQLYGQRRIMCSFEMPYSLLVDTVMIVGIRPNENHDAVSVRIDIYEGGTNGDPIGSSLAYGIIDNSSFHAGSIDTTTPFYYGRSTGLDKPIFLKKGKRYCVVISPNNNLGNSGNYITISYTNRSDYPPVGGNYIIKTSTDGGNRWTIVGENYANLMLRMKTRAVYDEEGIVYFKTKNLPYNVNFIRLYITEKLNEYAKILDEEIAFIPEISLDGGTTYVSGEIVEQRQDYIRGDFKEYIAEYKFETSGNQLKAKLLVPANHAVDRMAIYFKKEV